MYSLSWLSSDERSIGTPLACAASKGHEEIVNYLLGEDVEVNGKNKVCCPIFGYALLIAFAHKLESTFDIGF